VEAGGGRASISAAGGVEGAGGKPGGGPACNAADGGGEGSGDCVKEIAVVDCAANDAAAVETGSNGSTASRASASAVVAGAAVGMRSRAYRRAGAARSASAAARRNSGGGGARAVGGSLLADVPLRLWRCGDRARSGGDPEKGAALSGGGWSTRTADGTPSGTAVAVRHG